MTFEEIPGRMVKLGVDRAWLVAECDYSSAHIANILAPNGDPKSKTRKALRRIWEALDREEERQNAEPPAIAPLSHRVYIEPTAEQFDRWMAAAYSKPGRTFDEWAKAGLEELARQELRGDSELALVAERPGNESSPSIPALSVQTKYPAGKRAARKKEAG